MMIYDMVASGKRLKALRKQAGKTQEQMAELLCLSVDSISNYETGKTMCMPEHIAKICVICDTTSDYIYFGRKDLKLYNDKTMDSIINLIKQCDNEDMERIEKMLVLFLKR